MIDELYSGAVLTATDAAALCRLTPSAMSYHLRALEKWGIVVRDEGTTDGRERPWRAPARNLQISRAANAGSSTVAAKAFASSMMAPLRGGRSRRGPHATSARTTTAPPTS